MSQPESQTTPPRAPSAESGGEKSRYRATLNLPQTTFPMKANLVQNEPASVKRWQSMKLYDALRDKHKGNARKFVFHDGPPYANGNLHLGHLLNRCLKDFVVRSRSMMGFDCAFVPGWDCHGLPIEHKVVADLQEKGKLAKLLTLSDDQRKVAIRRECQAHAEKYVKLQRAQMERFLTVADYDHPYLTLQPSFEGGTLDVLAALCEQGLVYRGLKPVHWSIANETALADAELEYMDREDLSVYVDFEAEDAGKVYDAFGLVEAENEEENEETHEVTESRGHGEDASKSRAPRPGTRPLVRPSFMIWTTTPWTLPANLAIAVNPRFEYACVWVDGAVSIMASDAVQRVMKMPKGDAAVGDFVVLGTCAGDKLVGLKYRHPFVTSQDGAQSAAFRARETVRPDAPFHTIVPAEYVTLEDGTGLVHTAPGHGTEDYQTGLATGLPPYCPVRENGTYDDTVPAWLRGVSIWKANDDVAQHLKNSGHLFYSHTFTHSYPHDWRSKTPVIFRCTHQWFVSVERKFGLPNDPSQFPKESLRVRAFNVVDFDYSRPQTNWQRESVRAAEEENRQLWAENQPPDGVTPEAAGLMSGSRPMDDAKKAELAAKYAVSSRSKVEFIPEWGKSRMRGMLESRPDWCISRQRAWGMPIPAFTLPDGTVFMTAASVRAVAMLVREKGTDVWFSAGPEELLRYYNHADDGECPEPVASAIKQGVASWKKGADILDVWFESGSTWNACMRERGLAHASGIPVDLYLEGSDQHRGWFQSSLLTALGVIGAPPYKTLLTHGFIVDKDGKKLSKSRPDAARYEVESLCGEFGMDVMRWWVASLPYENDIKADLSFFAEMGESYRKIRNTLRFMLSNLFDFKAGDPALGCNGGGNCVPLESIAPASLDAWVLSEFDRLAREVETGYAEYDFRGVQQKLYDFCNDTLSAVYLAAVKDRLYCDKPDSPRRRQTQTVLWDLTDGLCRLLAPVLCHTSDEAYRALKRVDPKDATVTIHTQEFVRTKGAPGFGVSCDPAWATLLKLRGEAMVAIEQAKKNLVVENPLDMGVTLPDAEGALAKFDRHDLADLLGVSRVSLTPVGGVTVQDLRAEPRCERSWKRDGTVRQRSDGGMLSDRDAMAVGVA